MSRTPLDQHREGNSSWSAIEEVSREVESRGVEFIYYQAVTVTGRVIGKVVPAAQGGVFTVLLPISAALVGVLVLGESLDKVQFMALAIALAGVLLATLPRRVPH